MRAILFLLLGAAFPLLESKIPWEMNLTTYPMLSVNVYKEISDHQFDAGPIDPSRVKKGDIIYSSVARLPIFFNDVHPHIKEPYILITTYSDRTMPAIYKKHLDDPQIVAWYAQNAKEMHPKMHFIPIGVRPNIIQRYQHYPYFNGKRDYFGQKKHLLYSNFYLFTNPSVRKPLRDYMLTKPFCLTEGRLHYMEYINRVGESAFVLSPPGAGLDCYRTWEALMMGSIPVLIRNSISHHYKGLPVLVVNSWSDITAELLEKKRSEMAKETYNDKMLFADYWLEPIEKQRAQLRGVEYKPPGDRPYIGYQLLQTNSRLREIPYKQMPQLKEKSWYFELFSKEVVQVLGSLGTGTQGFLPRKSVVGSMDQMVTQAINHMIAQRLFLIDVVPRVDAVFLTTCNASKLEEWMNRASLILARIECSEEIQQFAQEAGYAFDKNEYFCWIRR